MPLHHFVDDELIKETKKIPKGKESENEALEEHSFIATCLKIGLKIEDLKHLEYKDVAKIMLCFIDETNIDNTNKTRRATQSDWDALAGGR